MCSDVHYVPLHTNKHKKKEIWAVLRCMSLFMLPASGSGNVTSLPLSLFTVAHFWEATTSVHARTHTAKSMLDHPVYVFTCSG